MTVNALIIGPAPDFLMKLGSVCIYHGAVISLTRPNGSVRSSSSSHPSFLNLIREISARIVAFGWTRGIEINWKLDELTRFSFTSPTGTAVVQYKIHPQMSVNQKNLLGHRFQNELKNLLRIQG